MQTVLRQTAAFHGVSVGDILGRSRLRRIARARQEAAFRLKNMPWSGGWRGKPSLPTVGGWLGLDHTTVLFSCRGHEARMAPPEYVEAVRVYQCGWAAGA